MVFDSHATHMSLDVIKLAIENDIHIITLPPHTTHLSLPLDKTCSGPLKSKYTFLIRAYQIVSPGKAISRKEFVHIFKGAYNAGLSAENLQKGFRKCGIYPVNINAVSSEDTAPVKIYQRPASATKVDILNALKEALKLSDDFLSVLPLPQMLQENDEKKKRPTINTSQSANRSFLHIVQLEEAKKKMEDEEEMKKKRMEEREKKRGIKEIEMMIKAMKREEKKGSKITTKRKVRAQENQVGDDDKKQVVNETKNSKRRKSSENEDLSLPNDIPNRQTDETEEGQRKLDDDDDKASRRSSRLRKPRVFDDFIIFNDVIIIDNEKDQQPEPQPSTSTAH